MKTTAKEIIKMIEDAKEILNHVEETFDNGELTSTDVKFLKDISQYKVYFFEQLLSSVASESLSESLGDSISYEDNDETLKQMQEIAKKIKPLLPRKVKIANTEDGTSGIDKIISIIEDNAKWVEVTSQRSSSAEQKISKCSIFGRTVVKWYYDDLTPTGGVTTYYIA